MKCGSMFSVYIWAEHRFRIELVPDGLNIIPSRMRVSTKITTSTPVVIAMPWAINLRISLPFDRIPIMHRHIWYSPFWAVGLYRSRRSKQTNHQVVSTSTLFMRCIVVPNQHLLFFFFGIVILIVEVELWSLNDIHNDKGLYRNASRVFVQIPDKNWLWIVDIGEVMSLDQTGN